MGAVGDDPINAQGIGTDRSPDTLSLLCALFGDEIEGLLLGKISTANDAAALTDAQKKSAVEKLTADLLVIERRECACIERGRNAVPYRANCSIAALLGLVQ